MWEAHPSSSPPGDARVPWAQPSLESNVPESVANLSNAYFHPLRAAVVRPLSYLPGAVATFSVVRRMIR